MAQQGAATAQPTELTLSERPETTKETVGDRTHLVQPEAAMAPLIELTPLEQPEITKGTVGEQTPSVQQEAVTVQHVALIHSALHVAISA